MTHEVRVPSVGESINEVYIGNWLKQNGQQVSKGEILVELETDKVNVELEAEWTGKLNILHPDAGKRLAIGEVLATIEEGGASAAASSPTSSKSASVSGVGGEPPMSPSVRKLIVEKGLDATQIAGSGRGGRISIQDVMDFAAGQKPASQSSASTAAPSLGEVAQPTRRSTERELPFKYVVDKARGDKVEPASAIRRRIAENLVASQEVTAATTTFNEIDMSAVMAWRKKHNPKIEKKHGVKTGIVGFFAMASVHALKEFPMVNATYTGEDFIHHPFVDLSVAVSTEYGLVVPVVRDANKMNLLEFERHLGDLSVKARERKLSIPEMTGGTFTISNGGVFGSLISAPIINMPQTAIMGLARIQERPVVVEKKIEVRPMMYVSLSYDHRVIDGREGVLFLAKIKECMENVDVLVDKKIL